MAGDWRRWRISAKEREPLVSTGAGGAGGGGGEGVGREERRLFWKRKAREVRWCEGRNERKVTRVGLRRVKERQERTKTTAPKVFHPRLRRVPIDLRSWLIRINNKKTKEKRSALELIPPSLPFDLLGLTILRILLSSLLVKHERLALNIELCVEGDGTGPVLEAVTVEDEEAEGRGDGSEKDEDEGGEGSEIGEEREWWDGKSVREGV